jgi:hypothetical protein
VSEVKGMMIQTEHEKHYLPATTAGSPESVKAH